MTESALRLTVLTSTDDRVGHHPLYHEIVTRARAEGLAGATVLRGCEGYGASGFVHTDRLLDAADDLPVTVIIIDAADTIRAFLPKLEDLGVTVLLDPVEVLR